MVKNEYANFVAKTITPIPTLGVFFGLEALFGSIVHPSVIAATTVVIGAAIFPTIKRFCKGSSHGREEMLHDVVIGLSDVGFRSAAKHLGSQILRYTFNGSRIGARIGVKRFLQQIDTGGDERKQPLRYITSDNLASALKLNGEYPDSTAEKGKSP